MDTRITQRRTNFTLPGEIPRTPGYFDEGTTSRRIAGIAGGILIGKLVAATTSYLIGPGPSIQGPSTIVGTAAQVGLAMVADMAPYGGTIVSTLGPAIMYGVGAVERKLTGN